MEVGRVPLIAFSSEVRAMYRGNVRRIKEAVEDGRLTEPLIPKEVNKVIGIDYAGVFLAKHRVGGPRPPSEQHFEQVTRGRYKLKR